MPYLDFNATAPLHPEARQTWLDVNDRSWHNPSGLYAEATIARDILDDARERLADLLGCSPERIVFTGGATAAGNALARHISTTVAADRTVAISAIEHPCMRDPFFAALPGRVVEMPVDRDGVVRLDDLAGMLRGGKTAFVSVMAASNETGVIQPWQEIAGLCRRHGAAFHTDAAQWLGKLSAAGIGACDWVTGSGHKFGGPKGVGFLVVAEAAAGFHGDRGGPQECGRWAGTENVAGIAAMVAALEACSRNTDETRALRAADRDAAERRLLAEIPGAFVVSGGAQRLWNTLAILLPGSDGKKLVARLGRAGVAASTGSACSTGTDSIPRVLAALGSPAHGMVRLSGGWQTTAEEWNTAVDALIAAARPAPTPRP